MNRTENPQQLPYGDIGLPNGGPQTGGPVGGKRRRRTLKVGGSPALVGNMGPMGGRRHRNRSRSRSKSPKKRGGALYEFSSGMYDPNSAPSGQLADGSVRVPPPAADWTPAVGGRRRSRKGTRKGTRKSGKQSPWLMHVMSIKNKKGNESMSLGDAMKEAARTYKK
jgi:hypothetical protein